MVEARVDQGGVNALLGDIPPVRVDQGGVLALISTGTPARVDQAGVNALVAITAETRVDQAGILFLASGSPCGTRWAQIWTITRTDGEIFRFTSKDTEFEYLGGVYQACDSLVPSASEHVSELDAASNMDLSGAISPTGITQEDLYAGLFDGAEVEAWLVPWSSTNSDETVPRRLLKGTFGAVEQGKTGFKVELLGDGAKLQQTPLVSLIQPGCRWLSAAFGGFGGPFCGKDLTALTVTGTVDSATGQRSFVDAARAETAGYFSQGRVTFTTGANAGRTAEIKEHLTGGVFEIWPLMLPIAAGDQYSMVPGCTGLNEAVGGTNGCTAWNNEARRGAWKSVPGRDKRQAAANVKSS